MSLPRGKAPPLRAHKKSRLGCRTCKQRKVKCDERRPVCGNCSRRFGSLEPCHFNEPAAKSQTESTSTLPPLSGPLHQLQSHCLVPALSLRPKDNMRRLELELFHHYTSNISLTMPRYKHAEVDPSTNLNLPQLCFSFDAVLSAVLGLAAIHYLSLDPGNSDMKRAAYFYQYQSVLQQSQLVSNITKETIEPALIVAILICMETRNRAAFNHQEEPYKLPLDYFHMLEGTTLLYRKSISLNGGSNVLTALGMNPPKFVNCTPARDFLPLFIREDTFRLLGGLDAEGTDPKLKSIYERCLAYLDVIYMDLLREESSQYVSHHLHGLPLNIDPGYVALLEQHDPRAMAILARYLALMKMSAVRSFQGTAEYDVYGIRSLMPQDWLWAMEWPVQILKLKKLADYGIWNVESGHRMEAGKERV